MADIKKSIQTTVEIASITFLALMIVWIVIDIALKLGLARYICRIYCV